MKRKIVLFFSLLCAQQAEAFDIAHYTRSTIEYVTNGVRHLVGKIHEGFEWMMAKVSGKKMTVEHTAVTETTTHDVQVQHEADDSEMDK